jgi:hypothetical protein
VKLKHALPSDTYTDEDTTRTHTNRDENAHVLAHEGDGAHPLDRSGGLCVGKGNEAVARQDSGERGERERVARVVSKSQRVVVRVTLLEVETVARTLSTCRSVYP